MPKAEIETHGVTIRLEAAEVSIQDLANQAFALYQRASEVDRRIPPGPAFGFQAEQRGEDARGYGTQWHQPQPTQEAA